MKRIFVGRGNQRNHAGRNFNKLKGKKAYVWVAGQACKAKYMLKYTRLTKEGTFDNSGFSDSVEKDLDFCIRGIPPWE